VNFSNLDAPAATPADFARAASVIGCEVAAFRAVVAVETGGAGFDKKGRPRALFEPHVFYRQLSGDLRRRAVNAGLAYAKWGTKPYPADSWGRILGACGLDEERALRATSWGLPQVLGENFAACGYANARELVAAFVTGEPAQLDAMADFIVANKLDKALRGRDWKAFARGYNGPGYERNDYDTKLATAYSRFAAAKIAPVVAPERTADPVPSTQRPQAVPPKQTWLSRLKLSLST
jgi:hypothetical protein